MKFDLFLMKLKAKFDDPNSLLKPIVYVVLCVMIAIVAVSGFFKIREYQSLSKQPKIIQEEQKENAKYFSILGSHKTKQNDGTYVVTYDLFMKRPFTNANTLNSELEDFCQDVKKEYNAGSSKKHPKLRAIGIRLYDRKLVYDIGLTPRGTVMFAMDPDYAQKITEKQDKKNVDKDDAKKIDPITGQKAGYITANSSLSPVQIAWKQTLNTKNKIDYDHWTMTSYGIQNYSKSSVSKPLSDQEFAFWLKLKEYEALIGTNDVDPAVQLYLNYDLNGKTDKQSFTEIAKEFEALDKREHDIGDSTNYFPNKVLLRQQAAIYRPQLLYFILSDGKMIKSYTKAQKALIKMSPEKYAQPIKQHAKEVAQNSNSYGDVNYYVEKQDGKTLNVDPFSGTSGKLKSKKPLYFQRPAFSPIPIMNNAWYPQGSSDYVSGQETD